VSSPTSSGGPSTNPFLSSPTAAATAGNTTQPIVDLFGSLPATAETSQVIIHNYRPTTWGIWFSFQSKHSCVLTETKTKYPKLLYTHSGDESTKNYRPNSNITHIRGGQLYHLCIFGGQVQQIGQPHKKVPALKGLLLMVISYICLYLVIRCNRLESPI